MIWIILNIILLIVGIGLIAASKYINEINGYAPIPEDIFDTLEIMLCAIGAVCLAFLVVSEPLRWWLG